MTNIYSQGYLGFMKVGTGICNMICNRYNEGINRWYEKRLKFCSICHIAVKPDFLYCPCCHRKLRTTPAYGKSNKRRNEIKDAKRY